MSDESAAPHPHQPVLEDVEELKADLQLAKQLAEDYLNGWKRAKADYLNLRKDVDKEKGEFIAMANAGLLLELLPIYDHFKLALTHIPVSTRAEEWVKGLEHIRTQFQDLLKRLNIEEVKTIGEPFNPEHHEAVAKEKRDGVMPNTILEEIKPGYRLSGRLLQPAKVKVAE